MPILAPTTTACVAAVEGQADGLLPADPFTALQFQFGMLLGVDDLDQMEAYPRGKMRLHNAWLHREGVVWGFNVEIAAPVPPATTSNLLQVDPGLALDAVGHELHLDVPSCVDLGAWYEAHKADFVPPVTPNLDGSVTFTVHVVVRFKACLTRQVPAISDPCAIGATDTAYSRAFETVDLFVRANASTPKPLPYHRLRLLFDLDDPITTGDPKVVAEDAAIVLRRDDIRQNHQLIDQPKLYLAAFREYAALDTIALQPAVGADGATTLFPEDDTTEVLLADVIGVTLVPAPGATPPWTLSTASAPTIVTKVRPSHVATATIQELLNGPLFGPVAAALGPVPPTPRPVVPGVTPALAQPPATPVAPPLARIAIPAAGDAGGPRVDPASLRFSGKKSLTFTVTGQLAPASIDFDAIELTTFDDDDGWANLEIKKASVDSSGRIVTLDLKEAPGGTIVRVIVRGTGPTPVVGIVGSNRIPLAGATGGLPGTKDNGNDFIATISVGS